MAGRRRPGDATTDTVHPYLVSEELHTIQRVLQAGGHDGEGDVVTAKEPRPAPRREDALTRPLHALVAGLAAIGLLAGCAASGSMPRPADFSRHTATPQVDLYWNLTRDGEEIQVDGLAVSGQPELVQATLELIGLDSAGEIVGTASASVRWKGWFPERFRMRLRSAAERFELRVVRVSYPSGVGR